MLISRARSFSSKYGLSPLITNNWSLPLVCTQAVQAPTFCSCPESRQRCAQEEGEKVSLLLELLPPFAEKVLYHGCRIASSAGSGSAVALEIERGRALRGLFLCYPWWMDDYGVPLTTVYSECPCFKIHPCQEGGFHGGILSPWTVSLHTFWTESFYWGSVMQITLPMRRSGARPVYGLSAYNKQK